MTTFPGYIRVTDVLGFFSKFHLIDPQVLSNAAERGKEVHGIIDMIIAKVPEFSRRQDTEGYIESFKKWGRKRFLPKPDRFFCDELGITGECDAIYQEEDGGLVLVDFKTPVIESKGWLLQCSAYAYMARKRGHDIKRVEVVRLSKTGSKPKIYVYEENFPLFLKCLEVYKYFFNQEEETVFPYL